MIKDQGQNDLPEKKQGRAEATPAKPLEGEEKKKPEEMPEEEPEKKPEEKKIAEPKGEKSEAQSKSSSKSLGRVLLVEDDPPMVKMYATKLEKEGFEVAIAYNGEDGLAKVKEWAPDLVLLDLMIPRMGGMDVLATIRSEVKTKNLPVLILSNLSQDQDVVKAKELGVKEFLIKANFTPGQVVAKIKEYIKK